MLKKANFFRILILIALLINLLPTFIFFGATQANADNSDFTFSAKWGTLGSGNDNLNAPMGIDLIENATLVIADSGNNRIQVFNTSGVYQLTIGEAGSDNGKFNNPKDVAWDTTTSGDNATWYVADSGNNRIQKFTSTAFSAVIGSAGSGDGQFNNPSAITVDSSRNLYVADTGNNRIQKFDSSGNFVAKWGTAGSGNSQFSSPQGIAATDNGGTTYIFVSDTGNNRIENFDSSGTFQGVLGGPGTGEGEFNAPLKITFDSDLHFYIADTGNSRIQVVNQDFQSMKGIFGTSGSGDGQFNNPSAMTADGAENTYVVDTGNNRIQKFGPVGGGPPPSNPPTAPGACNVPPDSISYTSLTIGWTDNSSNETGFEIYKSIDNSTFSLVTTTAANATSYGATELLANQDYWFKVRAINADGNSDYSACSKVTTLSLYTYSYQAGEQLSRPGGIDFDSSGNIYVTAGRAGGSMRKYNSSGSFLSIIEGTQENGLGSSGLAIDSNGNIYATGLYGYNEHGVSKFDSSGNFVTKWGSLGTGDGQFNKSSGIDIDGSNNVYVADILNHRIQKFNSSGTFITKWGSSGTGDGQFNHPNGVAIDLSNNVYVLDIGNYRVQKFDSSGTFLAKWGSQGSGDGQFNFLTNMEESGFYTGAIAVDGSGNVYVGNYLGNVGSNYIQKFDSSGNFLAKWGSNGSGNGQFRSGVMGEMAFDGSGNLYVPDGGNLRIQKFNSTGTYLGQIGQQGSTLKSELNSPYGVALSNTGNAVYIVDTLNHQLTAFDSSQGMFELTSTRAGGLGSGNGQFNMPTDVAVGNIEIIPVSENIYVVDRDNARVQKFTSNAYQTFTFISSFGTSGSEDGQFNNPNGIGIDSSENTYVADTGNNRMQKFNSSGTFLTKWGSSGSENGQFNTPTDAAVDSSGNIYVVDSGNNRIQKFDSSGNFSTKWGSSGSGNGQFSSPSRIIAKIENSATYIYVTDNGNNRVQKFDSSGNFVTKITASTGIGSSGFSNPTGIDMDGTGNIYIADTGNHLIQKFAPAIPISTMDAPTNCVTSNVTTTSITVGWTDNSSNETGFEVYKSTDGTTYTLATTTAANTVSYDVSTGLSLNTRYWFKVRAIKTGAQSDYATANPVYTLAGTTSGAMGFWAIEQAHSPASTGGTTSGKYISMAFDSSGEPNMTHIQDYSGASPKLIFTKKSGGTWSNEVAYTYTNPLSSAMDAQLALTSSNVPDVATINSADLVFLTKGESWSNETVDTSGDLSAPAIALTSDNTPAIAYYDSGTQKLKYAIKTLGSDCTSPNWTCENIGNTQNGSTSYLAYVRNASLTMKSTNIPAVAFCGNNASNQGDIYYAERDSGTWVITDLNATLGLSDLCATNDSVKLLFGANDTPMIIASRGTQPSSITTVYISKNNEGAWFSEEISSAFYKGVSAIKMSDNTPSTLVQATQKSLLMAIRATDVSAILGFRNPAGSTHPCTLLSGLPSANWRCRNLADPCGTTICSEGADFAEINYNSTYYPGIAINDGSNGVKFAYQQFAATTTKISIEDNNMENYSPLSNPINTEYAVKFVDMRSGFPNYLTKYLQADGTLGDSVVWQTKAVWGNKTVTGLIPNNAYNISSIARNGDGVAATESMVYQINMLPNTPAISSIAPYSTYVILTINKNQNVNSTDYLVQETTTGKYLQCNDNRTLGDTEAWETTGDWSYSPIMERFARGGTIKMIEEGGQRSILINLTSLYAYYNPTTNKYVQADNTEGPDPVWQLFMAWSKSATTRKIISENQSYIYTNSTLTFALQNPDTNKYMQADGSEGDSPVWRTSDGWGTETGNDQIYVRGLSPNTSYTFKITAQDGLNLSSIYNKTSATSSTTTNATPAGTPTLTSGSTSINVKFSANGNLDAIQYSIYETTTRKYVQSTGILGSSISLRTRTEWGGDSGVNVTGLTPNTGYSFKIIKQDNVESEIASEITLPEPPGAPTLSSPADKQLKIVINAGNNPETVQYAIKINEAQYIQGGGSLGGSADWGTRTLTWGGDSGYTLTGLTGSDYTVCVESKNSRNTATCSAPGRITIGGGAIVLPSFVTPPTCTPNWKYGEWSECKDGKHTRTKTDLAGCVIPSTETATCEMPCTPNWQYSEWSKCVNEKQIRTKTDANKCPSSTVITEEQNCARCMTDWICTEWSACNTTNYTQIRTCIDKNACGTTENRPAESQVCRIEKCTPQWECGDWSKCENENQTRKCVDKNQCGTDIEKPIETQKCTITRYGCEPVWKCHDWSACADNNQTRVCLDNNNCGTTSQKPSISQQCRSGVSGGGGGGGGENLTEEDLQKQIAKLKKEITIPPDALTREQFLAYTVSDLDLVNLKKDYLSKCSQNKTQCLAMLNLGGIASIKSSEKYYKEIDLANQLGLTSVFSENNNAELQIKAAVTKAEALKVILLALDIIKPQTCDEIILEAGGEENFMKQKTSFKDIGPGDFHKCWLPKVLSSACNAKIIDCTKKEFAPDSYITKSMFDEMIKMAQAYIKSKNLKVKLIIDTDKDGLTDVVENEIYYTNPLNPDTDGDGLKDGQEVLKYYTNPLRTDTDGDTLSDYDEINKYKTSALKADTDGDGFSDNIEINAKTNPLDPQSYPQDTRGVGVSDNWQKKYKVEVENGMQDTDKDGLVDKLEYQYGTDPRNPDTDGDSLTDGQEVLDLHTNPLQFTNLKKITLNITNISENQIIGTSAFYIKGTAQKNSSVQIFVKNDFGREKMIGSAVSAENSMFDTLTEPIKDGKYLLFAKAFDPKTQLTTSSPPINIEINSTLNIDPPMIISLGNTVTQEGKNAKIITSPTPEIRGKTDFGNEVVVSWKSLISSSALIADTPTGEFVSRPNNPLDTGDHKVTIYSVRKKDSVMSKPLVIAFEVNSNIKESGISEETAQQAINEKVGFARKTDIKPLFYKTLWVLGGIALLWIIAAIFRKYKDYQKYVEKVKKAKGK